MANEQDYFRMEGVSKMDTTIQHSQQSAVPAMASEDDIVADMDEPPERTRVVKPAPLQLQHSNSFVKSKPRCDRQFSLLTSALQASSSNTSPVEEHADKSPMRGMSTGSTWSNDSVMTAELTSDGGFTSPVSRASTPSPPPPSSVFRNMMPFSNRKQDASPAAVVVHGDDHVGPLQKPVAQAPSEQNVEAVLGRKRCIMFACGKKEEKKPVAEPLQAPAAAQPQEPAKRVCTIKFACPTKISTDAPSQPPKPRTRMSSPPPPARRFPSSPKTAPKAHRDSDSTVRNNSPVSVRKVPAADRPRRMSLNKDLARCEAYRFHEFLSSEEEVEEWTQESTCHRSRLTVSDTLKVENGLRQLGEEVEEEAIEEEDEEDVDDDDELLDDEDEDNSDAYSEATDEGFQTDDENGFAVSDDESDAGSDYNWWAPGASTAATSIEHLEQLRLKTTRSVSESSIASLESVKGFHFPDKLASQRKSKKTKPMNIRAPSPELPDSTDFVCGTLDEDRPLEDAYVAALEQRRAAKHKPVPQDIDPTFPTSDPELPDDEEDEVSEVENLVSESDNQFMLHGRMDQIDGDVRGRRKDTIKKRSPIPSPKRLRSPPPAKRTVHRSPPPRKLFGASPKRLQSPPPMRLRSPPPTRRGSVNPLAMRQRSEMAIRFGGIGERPAPVVSASVPRTPLTPGPNPLEYDDEDDMEVNDMPVRRAIDIQVGLERKRQRRKEQLYKKQHRKAATKEKQPPKPGRGAERMREMGLAAQAYKGKTTVFNPFRPHTPDQKDMHVLSV